MVLDERVGRRGRGGELLDSAETTPVNAVQLPGSVGSGSCVRLQLRYSASLLCHCLESNVNAQSEMLSYGTRETKLSVMAQICLLQPNSFPRL